LTDLPLGSAAEVDEADAEPEDFEDDGAVDDLD